VPSVAELSAPYANFMLSPRPGPSTCEVCFNFTRGYQRCYACDHSPQWLEVVAPISYSVATEQLHRALMVYKRLTGEVARRVGVELAAVLWRYLAAHERCVAQAAGLDHFQLVTTVAATSIHCRGSSASSSDRPATDTSRWCDGRRSARSARSTHTNSSR
jgi:hypothetical protein